MVVKKQKLWCSVLVIALLFGAGSAYGQSNLKEGNNQFALFTRSGDIKQLESARKFADAAYTTKRDSLNFRNNLLRALVYSTLSVVDSARKQKYTDDPIIVATKALANLRDRQLAYENEPEITHIRLYLANGHLLKANRAAAAGDLQEAYDRYRSVDSLDRTSYNVNHNLAVLSHKLGRKSEAIQLYEGLIGQSKSSKPAYIHALADLYEQEQNRQKVANILLTGRDQFPDDKDILFRLINFYNDNKAYDSIVPLIDAALKHEPSNIDLLYLGGFASEEAGSISQAKQYYTKLIQVDEYNYQGNYAMGLIYLRDYLSDPKNRNHQTNAQDYLLRANQIKPSAVNALQSLALFYETNGNIIQLERVNNILNQLTLN